MAIKKTAKTAAASESAAKTKKTKTTVVTEKPAAARSKKNAAGEETVAKAARRSAAKTPAKTTLKTTAKTSKDAASKAKAATKAKTAKPRKAKAKIEEPAEVEAIATGEAAAEDPSLLREAVNSGAIDQAEDDVILASEDAEEDFDDEASDEEDVDDSAGLEEEADAALDEEDGGEAEEDEAAPRPAAKLERLQKILSQAGIASRRHAEELIAAGHVMVNGQIVTALGSKADPARDHIRVDGKLLHGAERHRYFLLNKPRGYVTTLNDPEGRPTVMQFFAGARERVYPVGRLDFQSEGLLLLTNDGELANQLTRAGSGVEKTYLVKVAGQPSEEQLEKLRAGVAIEKGAPGSARVRTAPAVIRQVRAGENPWFEVVLIEGRNRELRKMFSAIGHFAEKIRRVGYGPLALDVEPGKMRELTAEEVEALRRTAAGKMKPRRLKTTLMLPKEAGIPAEMRAQSRTEKRGRRDFARRESGRSFDRPAPREDRGEGRSERPFAGNREFRGGGKARPEFGGNKPFGRGKPGFERRDRGPFQPRNEEFGRESKGRNAFGGERRQNFGERRPSPGDRPRREGGEQRFDRGSRPPFKPSGQRPAWKRNGEARPQGEFKPRGEFRPRSEFPPRGESRAREDFKPRSEFKPRRDFKPRGEFQPRNAAKPRGEFPPRDDFKARSEFKPRENFKPRREPDGRPEGARGAGFGKSGSFGKSSGFGGGKPPFGSKPSFGGRPGSSAKPGFQSKPGFKRKPGGSGNFGGKGGGAKRGFSRPGAQRGGWKRS